MSKNRSRSPSGEGTIVKGMLPTSNDRPAAARHTPVGRHVCLLLSCELGARDCDDAFAPEKRKNSKHRINCLPINSLSIFCKVVTVWRLREVSAPTRICSQALYLTPAAKVRSPLGNGSKYRF